ncbi:hypothetical protein JR316_0000986 [Psilocybe cubensis]|uniref:Uncharacterized protein n=2 Tax=Psilocybe cubensis TaxID=181762 RepID=A0ACB8HI72_PSICU|nr:hypothetical protein JR316_0000986 [Psilocybe cubensis]KAH9486920.1 hypothetical protein JR316_0000986 [Psilocybe cubensis]
MSASQFASFAAYTPPPDEHEQLSVPSGTTKASSSWLHSDPPENSYQSGIIPTLHSDAFTGSTLVPARQLIQSQWETRYGWRVDILAACSYILGPISALLLLIVETHNDYVRFHAYQSALLTTPLLTFRVVLSLVQFPRWLQSLCTVFILSLQCYMR